MNEINSERPASLADCNRVMVANFAADPRPARLLIGRGAPDAGIGAEGDLYLDGVAKAWFGPKGPEGWGAPWGAESFSAKREDAGGTKEVAPAAAVSAGLEPAGTAPQDSKTNPEAPGKSGAGAASPGKEAIQYPESLGQESGAKSAGRTEAPVSTAGKEAGGAERKPK